MPDGSAFVGAYLPLIVSSRGVDVPLGSIGFGWRAPRGLDTAERRTLTALAALAAVAVDRDRLASTAAERSEWFERMAHTDPLTGLANERTVGRILELELARAGRQGSEVSFALFDVDDFQATNREGGNEAGDAVLRRVASVLAESVRLVDTVGRIGGDEFVLVAPGSAGMTVAQRVLDGIAALPAVAGRPITVSAGVARFPADGTDSEALIAAAKDGLARARAEGRGTVASGVAPAS
jgi:diguanylate cyclase (GGDEF)-like protein